ncbi:hypothetical protein K469DRAFT_615438 [Zopfia rhizophila CBS 207.26]|uniref:Uncharacterized protein n=1 Tax=Zopfia rhizophila CBS 207.26 TaxID=1314779 RepID=A0A6A6EVW5_9PEZI|nr:hypothetical protein K469DRAFT_615438 [Zopfia rhizophila CBS 207.26]
MRFTTIINFTLALAVGQTFAAPTPDSSLKIARQEITCANGEGVCDQFGRCGRNIPPNEFQLLRAEEGECDAAIDQDAVAAAEQDDAFSNFASGKGNEIFGNAGVACQVGNEEGECDQFGRCAQFIPPNENSILNQGQPVDECVAGGPVGVLKV